MGLFDIFSKKDEKEKKVEQVNDDIFTPVVEPVGDLPVSNIKNENNDLSTPADFSQLQFDNTNKFVEEPINFNNTQSEIIFDDSKPASIYTSEQQEYISNNYFLSPSYKTSDEFSFITNNDSSNDEDFSYVDDELPETNNDFNNSPNNLDNDNQENEHKFFSSSVDEIDNYKNQLGEDNKDKTKILGDASIFGIARIDDEGH